MRRSQAGSDGQNHLVAFGPRQLLGKGVGGRGVGGGCSRARRHRAALMRAGEDEQSLARFAAVQDRGNKWYLPVALDDRRCNLARLGLADNGKGGKRQRWCAPFGPKPATCRVGGDQPFLIVDYPDRFGERGKTGELWPVFRPFGASRPFARSAQKNGNRFGAPS